jgi:hypothetical protein
MGPGIVRIYRIGVPQRKGRHEALTAARDNVRIRGEDDRGAAAHRPGVRNH